jgi:intracellular sulfur oxidation DsrE/DsrF family protein
VREEWSCSRIAIVVRGQSGRVSSGVGEVAECGAAASRASANGLSEVTTGRFTRRAYSPLARFWPNDFRRASSTGEGALRSSAQSAMAMIPRRDFLYATTTLAMGVCTSPPKHAAPLPGWNRAAFEAILARPYRHRQVFASTRLADGLVLHYMENSLDSYEHGFEDRPGTLHTAAVLYGTSLAVAMNNAMWAKYPLPSVVEPSAQGVGARVEGMVDALLHGGGDAALASSINPYAAQVGVLVERGASFFVCNNALRGFSDKLSAKMSGSSAAAIRDDLAGHLLPGAMVVPAGVGALNAAQEAHFTFIQATLD